jgi:histidyl-tRNA synthetase
LLSDFIAVDQISKGAPVVGATLIQRAPGTRDFYPEDLRLRNWLFEKMRAVSRRYGYDEYDGPLLESYELFAAKSGDQLVGEEMYVLTDRGDRRLGIRPEMTPTLARMVAQRQRQLRLPLKWFAIPVCWRYERPQQGRLREFWQWNVDLLGISSGEAEAEIIAVFLALLAEVGLTGRDIKVRIGHRGWVDEELSRLAVPSDARLSVLRVIDRREKLGEPRFKQQLAEIGLDAGQISKLIEFLDARDYSGFPPLRELMEILERYGLRELCECDPSIVRGLAYYTSTVFEIWDVRRQLRAIAGGGRYDDLTVDLGGDRLPAVGMAMGDVILALLLKREGKLPSLAPELDVFVACYSADENGVAIQLAQRLRGAGLRVDRSLQPATLSRQLRQAETGGARIALIVAPDELRRGEVVVRNLVTGSQSAVLIDQVASALAETRIDV